MACHGWPWAPASWHWGLAALHSHGTAPAKEVVLALFPLTHPLALLNDLVRWRKKAWLPPACYILAWILWSWGGFRAHQHEFERMHRILAQLKYEAQPIRATDLARVSVDPERNRWDHPYLRPLAEAANPGEDGPKTQEAIDRSYAAYQRPRSRVILNEEAYDSSERPLSTYQPFSKYALQLPISNLQKRHQKLWQLCSAEGSGPLHLTGAALGRWHRKGRHASLQEALERPENHYPYAWEEGFAMLLPQLSTLRNMATAQSLKTTHRPAWRSRSSLPKHSPGHGTLCDPIDGLDHRDWFRRPCSR